MTSYFNEEFETLPRPALEALQVKRLRDVLSGTGVLQLVRERLHNLRELGRVLLDKYSGRASVSTYPSCTSRAITSGGSRMNRRDVK